MTHHQANKGAFANATDIDKPDRWAIDRAVAEWHAARARLADPDTPTSDAELATLLGAEQGAVRKIVLAPALTLEGLMSKFALLTSELADTKVPASVRLLVASIQTDAERLMDEIYPSAQLRV
ncbi:MAG: hypothetical protein AAFX07_08845 [Pseudomonadota bacterium]